MTDRFRRPRRRASEADRINTAFRIGAVRRGLTWFKPPASVQVTAGRVGSYAGAKDRAHAFAAQAETAAEWAARELHRPKHTADMTTVRFAGKPYHWRQDYTGQLKLAAGESPW